MARHSYVFQFPSNGKVDPNFGDPKEPVTIDEFQFPSNGKVDPNYIDASEFADSNASVSIPFKRESGS